VDATGTVTTIAGNFGPDCQPSEYCGDGVPAAVSNLDVPNGLDFAPDGSLLIASNLGRVLRVVQPLPRFGVGNFVIPSDDASAVYVFDTTGRHIATYNGLTNNGLTPQAQIYQFDYDIDPSTGLKGRLKDIRYLPGTSHLTKIGYD